MIQGDQYQMPLTIKMGETDITPDNCAGVKVSVGGTVKEYPGAITYDAESGEWLYPLTQAQTLGMHGLAVVQIQVNMGGDFPEIITSEATCEPIGETIIQEAWGE